MSEPAKEFQRYTVEWIRLRDLSPHPKVQRAFDEAWAKSIETSFDPDMFRELYAVKAPGGRYWVFDGQHRLVAARAYLGDDQKVPCRVWDSIPIERQAELFLKINRAKAVKALDTWFVRAIARDETVLKIDALLHRHNLHVSKTRGDGAVQAVLALESIWKRKGGESALDRILSVLGKTWGNTTDTYDVLILRGLAEVVHRFPVIDDRDLSAKLARKGTPRALVGKARSAAQMMAKGPTRSMAEIIVNIYNERRRQGRLEF